MDLTRTEIASKGEFIETSLTSSDGLQPRGAENVETSLLATKGIATSNKNATSGSWHYWYY